MHKKLILCSTVRSIVPIFRTDEKRHLLLSLQVNHWAVERLNAPWILYLKFIFFRYDCAEWSASDFILLMLLIEFWRNRPHFRALSWNCLWFTEITQNLSIWTCVNFYAKVKQTWLNLHSLWRSSIPNPLKLPASALFYSEFINESALNRCVGVVSSSV